MKIINPLTTKITKKPQMAQRFDQVDQPFVFFVFTFVTFVVKGTLSSLISSLKINIELIYLCNNLNVS